MERIIHQIWVGPYPMPSRERGYVDGMRSMHPDFSHRLWTDENLPAMPPFLQERYSWRMSLKDYAFAADIARVYLTWLLGGIYLDVDTEVGRGFDGMDVSRWDGMFRHHEETDHTFSNDFIGLSKGHPLGWFMLQSMAAPAYDFGPHWLAYTVRSWLGLEKEADQQRTRAALVSKRMLYMPSRIEDAERLGSDAWNGRFNNRALFSWSDENRKRFANGEMR